MAWEWFFFWQSDDDDVAAIWTVLLPALAAWAVDVPGAGLVAEVQE